MQTNKPIEDSFDKKWAAYFALVIVFIYVVLFELILPYNKIFPKPTILFESFISLVNDYGLILSIVLTTSVVYISLFLSSLIFYFFLTWIIKFLVKFPGALEPLVIFRYFTPFFLILILVLWFEDAFYAEYIFAIILTLSSMVLALKNALNTLKMEYIDSARSFGIAEDKLFTEILWKSLEPEYVKSIDRLHYNLWLFVLLYEFISGIAGLGGIYFRVIEFRDLAACIVLAIVISLIILSGNIIIQFIIKKRVFWES